MKQDRTMLDPADELRPAAWPEFLRAAESPRARTHLEATLMRIQRAHRAGDRRQLRYLIQQFLTSFDARLAVTRLPPGRCAGIAGLRKAS